MHFAAEARAAEEAEQRMASRPAPTQFSVVRAVTSDGSAVTVRAHDQMTGQELMEAAGEKLHLREVERFHIGTVGPPVRCVHVCVCACV